MSISTSFLKKALNLGRTVIILTTEKIFHFSAGHVLSRLIHGSAPERQYPPLNRCTHKGIG